MEDEIFIPVLHSFENGNTFSRFLWRHAILSPTAACRRRGGNDSGRAVAWTLLL